MPPALHLYIQLQDALNHTTGPLRLHLAARVLQDALSEATATYWLRRAQQFEDAAPRLDEYHGGATRDELNQRWIDCMATAEACRNHAQLIRESQSEHISTDVLDALAEVA